MAIGSASIEPIESSGIAAGLAVGCSGISSAAIAGLLSLWSAVASKRDIVPCDCRVLLATFAVVAPVSAEVSGWLVVFPVTLPTATSGPAVAWLATTTASSVSLSTDGAVAISRESSGSSSSPDSSLSAWDEVATLVSSRTVGAAKISMSEPLSPGAGSGPVAGPVAASYNFV